MTLAERASQARERKTQPRSSLALDGGTVNAWTFVEKWCFLKSRYYVPILISSLSGHAGCSYLKEDMRLVPMEGRPEPTIDLSEYVDGLYSYALVLSRDRAEAEDLVQETCLRAIRAMGRLRPDGNPKSWIFTILRNIWFNQLRQWRTAPEVVELDLDGVGANRAADTRKDPHATYVSNIEREQVRAAIQQLPVEFREIIILREYEDLSYQEIATVLKCPLGTVMSRLARARSKLRDLLSVESLAPRSVKKVTSGAEETGNMKPRQRRDGSTFSVGE
jgi:RNA polymerase sigma-70 factor (ECF subfamily)